MPTVEEELRQSETYTPLQRMRHSAAHVMAEAVLALFPGARFAIGPAIEDGFYYDFDLPRPLTPDDLRAIEARMRESIAARPARSCREDVPRAEARALFAKDQPYKVELIDGLPRRRQRSASTSTGRFVDLCRGPHVATRARSAPFKLLSVAGAYWRGDEQRPDAAAHLRHGAGPTQAELEGLPGAAGGGEQRDHRKLGPRAGAVLSATTSAPASRSCCPRARRIRRLLEELHRGRETRTATSTSRRRHLAKRALQTLGPLGPLPRQHVPADGDGATTS